MNSVNRILSITTFGIVATIFTGFITTEAYANRVIVIEKPSHYYKNVPHNRHNNKHVVVPRNRHYHGVRVSRPHGRAYHGYGFFHEDNDAYKYLAFTRITLKVLDMISEDQQRMHEAAQVKATSANVGETIVWQEGDASGTVKTTRMGTSTSGRQCREFQQTVTIGGKTEQAYGTACLKPDGAWELIN
ncbi:MAG: RT0821/Lpp0805 family surface protein [Gammaproteobacteria bacterium]|nr:RT0821/Lpp0805 family surface protein [Gammaproteobacteria bacterium]